MKYYKNENFRLCLSTQIFMLFDLYVISYDTTQTLEYEQTLQDSLKNRTLNIDEFYNDNNILKYSKTISDVNSAITVTPYNLSYKNINKVNVNTSNIYVQTEPQTTHHLILLQIKKFDKFNYIVPIMATLNHDQLILRNNIINLEQFFEFKDNTKLYAQMLTTFGPAKII